MTSIATGAFHEDDPTARHGVYRALFDLLFPLSVQERQKQLNHLLVWAGGDRPLDPRIGPCPGQRSFSLLKEGWLKSAPIP